MRKKTIVITGGAGFIGSHLCKRLLAEKNRVICIDNFITGSLDNIRDLIKDSMFTLLTHNVCSHISIQGKVDYVLHCASLASPSDYLDFPIQTLKVGSLGTHNALGLSKAKSAVFMLFSTSEVYGDPSVHPQKEEYWGNVNPIGVRGCYDESKRFAEAITMAYRRVHKIDTKIVRIFNTYGPMMRENDGRVVSNFITQAILGKPVTIYGDGKQTRSFCYIDDLIEGLFRLMCSSYNYPVNLGNPTEFTVAQLAKIVLRLTESKSKVILKGLPQDDPRRRKPDISLARKTLKWNPKVKLEDGLKKTISWFEKTLKNT